MRANEGMALVMALLVLSVLSIMLLCGANRFMVVAKMTGDHTASAQAYYTAVSARAQALYYLENNAGADGYDSGLLDLQNTSGVLIGQYKYNITDLGAAGSVVSDITATTDNQQFEVWNNDGTGALTQDAESPYVTLGVPYCAAAADIDGDSDCDIVMATGYPKILIYTNDGSGNYSLAGSYTPGNTPRCLAVGDVTGSGSVDIVVGTDSAEIEVWNNDGSGSFSKDSECPYSIGATPKCLALACMEDTVGNDLDLDIVVGTDNNEFELWLNDGSGNFSIDPSSPESPDATPRALALNDVDNDNDIDVVVGTANSELEVWLNNGQGKFPGGRSSLCSLNGNPNAMALTDATGDGYADALTATDNNEFEVWFNDQSAVFTRNAVYSQASSLKMFAVLAVDIDSDLDEDAVAGSESGQIQVWLNDGSGGFSQASDSPHSASARVWAAVAVPRPIVGNRLKGIEIEAYYPTKAFYDENNKHMPRAKWESVVYAKQEAGGFVLRSEWRR